MKRFLLLSMLLISASLLSAQNVVENFVIGPYEVDYKGQGNVNFRLRKGIDLYEYFNLKKDTVLISNISETPLKRGIQIDLSFSMPRYSNCIWNRCFEEAKNSKKYIL